VSPTPVYTSSVGDIGLDLNEAYEASVAAVAAGKMSAAAAHHAQTSHNSHSHGGAHDDFLSSESPDSGVGLALDDLSETIGDVDLTVLGADGDPTLALSPTAFHDFFGSWCV
jgi:hypothetical protein